MFKGTKLEVESILREMCERVQEDLAITRDSRREKAQLRAVALQMLGEAYSMNVRKDGARKSKDSYCVKVEMKLRRARNGAVQAKQDGTSQGEIRAIHIRVFTTRTTCSFFFSFLNRKIT